MTAFLTIAALMTAMALAFILPVLLGKQRGGGVQAQRDQVNLAVLRDQMRELDADLSAGTIDAAAYDSARHELEQRANTTRTVDHFQKMRFDPSTSL